MQVTSHSSSLRIFLGLSIGVLFGALTKAFLTAETQQWVLTNLTQPVGTVFLRGLFMVVVPLVFSSLVVGVAELGSVKRLGNLGWKLGAFYLCTTAIAVILGQLLVTTLAPGEGVDPKFIEAAKSSLATQTQSLVEKSAGVNESLWPGLVQKIVPKNIVEDFAQANMLAIIFFAIILGVAFLKAGDAKARTALDVFSSISDAMIRIVNWIMRLAPYAVACLMFNAVLQFDLSILNQVAKYFGVVLLGYTLHFLGVYGLIVRFLIRIPVQEFFQRMTTVFVTAFSSSSSNATLPTTIATLQQKFGVPEKITTFTAPLGATVNMDGTALFEMVAAIFIAQVFGVELSLLDHVTLIILIIVTSVGVAGVPGGSIPLLMSAMATVGIPPEGIALVLGVDRVLDMGRTVVNVTGDAVACLFLARVENVPLEQHLANPETSG